MEEIYGVTHDETPTKTWDCFCEYVTCKVLQMLRHDTGKTLKYYITNALRKPNRVPIHQFLVRVEQLNSYLETLPCLYYSPSANQANKKVLPLDNANLATHLLGMCPAKWQMQYDLREKKSIVSTRGLLLVVKRIKKNTELEAKPPSMIKSKGADGKCKMKSMDFCTPKMPKQVGWSDKHCVLCIKHGGPYNNYNTHDCHKYNPASTPINRDVIAGRTRKSGGMDKHHSKKRDVKEQILLRLFVQS